MHSVQCFPSGAACDDLSYRANVLMMAAIKIKFRSSARLFMHVFSRAQLRSRANVFEVSRATVFKPVFELGRVSLAGD